LRPQAAGRPSDPSTHFSFNGWLADNSTSILKQPAKSRVELFARSIPSFDAVIGAWPAWYFENFLDPEYAQAFGGFPLYPDAEGYLTFTSPRIGGQGTVQTVSVADDFGEMVHAMFLDAETWAGCTVPCMSDSFSYEDMVAAFMEGTYT
jgi:hypothetical protein